MSTKPTKKNKESESLKEQIIKLEKQLETFKHSNDHFLKNKLFLHYDIKEPEKVVVDCETKLPVLAAVDKKKIQKGRESDPNHLIIEGDNYHALSVLNYTHAGKVDVVYIDPPYNTGNNDFVYNDRFVDREDSFRHSKWLSFMAHRLRLAKNLLAETGVIFISIDDNEQAHLRLLCDQIFGEENFVNQFVWISNLKGRQISSSGAARTYEYVLCYAKSIFNIDEFIGDFAWLKEKMPSSYKGFDYEKKKDEIGEYYITNELHNTNSKFNEETRPNLVFDIYYNPKTKEIITEDISNKNLHKGFVKISPKTNNNGTHKYHAYRWSRDKIANEPYDLDFVKSEDTYKIYTKRRNFTTIVKDLITDINTTQGSADIKELLSKGAFDYPKPVNLIQFILDIVQNKSATIMDFFAGSGTTGHAVLKLNAQDGGTRQFILCTNNENKIAENVTYPRIKKVIDGYGATAGIPATLRYFKTDFVEKKGNTSQLKIDLTRQCAEMLCVKENVFDVVKLKKQAKNYKLFKNGNKYLGVFFDFFTDAEFARFIKELNALPKEAEKAVYVFVLDGSASILADEFAGVANCEVKEIPQKILDIYKQLAREVARK